MPVKKKLSEIWADVEGSYEEIQSKLRDALDDTSAFGEHDEWCGPSLEATFPDYIIVEKRENGKRKYLRADWKENEAGGIEFSDVKKVTATVAIKAVNESKQAILDARGMQDMSEVFISPITFALDEEATKEAGKDVIIGRVQTAQVADTLNRNKRLYPKDLLRDAIADVNEKIEKFGPLPMDYLHREKEGKNYRNIKETVAVIHEVKFNEDDGTVSLEDIRLINTQAGKDLQAVLDGGLRLQVSQRAAGVSEILKNEETGDIYERVTKLKIDSWDFLAGGDASVEAANFEYEVISEAFKMDDKKVLTEEGFAAEWDEKVGKLTTDVTASVIGALKTAGVIKDPDEEETPADTSTDTPEPDEDEDKDKSADEDTPPEPVTTTTPVEAPPAVITEVIKADPAAAKKMAEQAKQFSDMNTKMNELAQAGRLNVIKNERATIGKAIFTDERYSHFSDADKAILESFVTDDAIMAVVPDPTDAAILAEQYGALIGIEADKLDKILAGVQLKSTGFPTTGAASGISHVTVTNESKPWMATYEKMQVLVMNEMNLLINPREYRAPDDSPAMLKLTQEILPSFDAEYGALLLEAGEEVVQLDIGPRVALISRLIIDAAYRTLTALGVYNVGSMTERILDVPVKSWLPAEDSDILTYMNAINVGEGGTMPMTGVHYVNYPIYAVKRAVRTSLNAEAIATAKGTVMDPLANVLAGMALDIRNRMDLQMWYLVLARGMEQGITEVTAYADPIDLGGDVWQLTTDDTIVATGICPIEYYKTVDANGNPTGAGVNPLFASPAASTYQALEVREKGGDQTDLDYADDYAIDWNTGKITLTDEGVVKEDSNDLEAKFSYTTNIDFWSMTPDAGVQLYDHLINLRQAMGEAIVAVENRHYSPTVIGLNLSTEVLITSGPQFTQSGARNSDAIDTLNKVIAMLGLGIIRTSAIPRDWIPIMERDVGVYRSQTPWSVKGPLTDVETGTDIYQAIEFSGIDVPVNGKIALVGIQDLESPWTSE